LRWLLLAVPLCACSFEAASLSGGGGADAGADGGGSDAGPGPFDAMPDALPDQCTAPSTALMLGQSLGGTTTGFSRYANPTCPGGGDSAESIFRLEVSGASGHDLVFDVSEPQTGANDSQLDISLDCTPQTSVLPACVDVAPRGHGDVAVLPNVENRRYYLVVDAFGTNTGAFTVNPTLRPVVVLGQPCTVDLRGARCQSGFCVTTADTKTASCQSITSVAESDSLNDTRCGSPHMATGDFVMTGAVDDIFDADWVQLSFSANQRIQAVLYGPNGGCAVDARLELFSGNTCLGASEQQSDADSGLGPCPVLITPAALDMTLVHAIRVELDDGAPLPTGGAPYTLVIDYIDE
jgi:hypothetical protein